MSAVFKWRGSIWSRFCVFLNWANSAKTASNWSKIPWKSCQKLTFSNLILLRLLLKFYNWNLYKGGNMGFWDSRDFQIQIPIPGILVFLEFRSQDFSGFFEVFISPFRSPGFRDSRDFALGIFSGFSNPDPDPRNFEIFGISRSSPKLKIPIPKKSHPEANSALEWINYFGSFYYEGEIYKFRIILFFDIWKVPFLSI